MRVRSGPEMGLLIALVPVMLAYTIFCMLDLHPLLKPVQVTALSVAATAGLETLRFAAIFTVPALAAFAVRFYLLDQHASDRHSRGEAPRLTAPERLGAILLGAMVAVVFLALVALLWAAALSPTSVQFQLLLFRGDFLMYFVTQAGIAAVVLSVALPACDLTSPQSAWVRRGLGLFCAVAVLLYLLFYFGRWYNGLQCSMSGTPFIPGVLTEQICFRDNSAVDYLIYPIAAFLTCAVFGRLPKGTTAPAGAPRRRWRFGAGVAAGAAAAALLLAVAVALPAHSQDCGGESCEVKIGFRTDVEPFSYLVRTDDRPEFKGYLAGLCYALFHGSAYQVKALAVTVTDRFRRIDGGAAPSEDPPVDMLCDPTTLRFSGVRQEVKGFYSPIVFVSGVTDLVRKSSDARTVAYIGFARNTTAKNVARKACEIDLLRIRDPGASPQPGECDPMMPAAKDFCASSGPAPMLATRGPAPSLAAAGPSDRPRYYFCPKDSHPELIEWFCRKNVDSTFDLGFHMAYFGDREIIQGKLAAFQKEAGRECPGKYIEPDPTNYTYEPYALVVSAKRPALAQFVQRRVYTSSR